MAAFGLYDRAAGLAGWPFKGGAEPEDILVMWKEKIAEKAVELLRESMELEKEGKKLSSAKEKKLQACRRKLKFAATAKGASQVRLESTDFGYCFL